MPPLLSFFGKQYDALFTPDRVHRFERRVIQTAIAGFVVHLFLIFLARTLPDPPALLAGLDRSYLSALYTPFSFILFGEVFQLVLSIPRSISLSLGRQYEIVSLIFIRNVFKDISKLDGVQRVQPQLDTFLYIFTDMGGGLLMFFMVAIFFLIRRKARATANTARYSTEGLERYINSKKAVSLVLAILFILLACTSFVQWGWDVFEVAVTGAESRVDINQLFFIEVFTVMIFSDVLILLFSLLLTDDYRLIVRNAGFIISTILIRISLALDKPFDAALASVAMLFGILILLVFLFSGKYGDEKGYRPERT